MVGGEGLERGPLRVRELRVPDAEHQNVAVLVRVVDGTRLSRSRRRGRSTSNSARIPTKTQLARAVPFAGDEVAVARDHGVRAALGRGDEEREVRVRHEADALVLACGLEKVRAACLDLQARR